MSFELTTREIDPGQRREAMLTLTAGAYCSYEGWVRDHNEGKAVSELHYGSYTQLAPSVAESILNEAKEKFRIEDAAIVHRYGPLKIGAIAVWVGVTAHHRDASFLACRYIIDNVKFRLPVWKKEIYSDGTTAWIENHMCGCADPSNLEHHRHEH
ncbi:MAG: molybdenum cofactor biosynthesis protein MoaE [Opitutales bacterium]